MKKLNIITRDINSSIPIMGHIFETPEGQRVEICNTSHTPPDMSAKGYRYVYSAYATPKAAKSYLNGRK